MTSRTGPTPSSRQPVAATAQDGLEQRLRRDLDGDVAFDDYTRHLFSRDASMYAITPRGVVFPGTPVTSRPRSRPPPSTTYRSSHAGRAPASPDRPWGPDSSSTCPAI